MNVTNIWYLIGGALLAALIGWRIRPRAVRTGYRLPGGFASLAWRFGRLLLYGGLVVAVLGVYAGTMGPIVVWKVRLPPFEQAQLRIKKPGDPVAYARKDLVIEGGPALGWSGYSSKNLGYVVENQGDRKLRYIVLRLNATLNSGHAYHDAELWGPFYPGESKQAFTKVPGWVDRAYFTRGPQRPSEQIVGAGF